MNIVEHCNWWYEQTGAPTYKLAAEEIQRLYDGLEEIATKPPPDDAYELRMMARKLLEHNNG